MLDIARDFNSKHKLSSIDTHLETGEISAIVPNKIDEVLFHIAALDAWEISTIEAMRLRPSSATSPMMVHGGKERFRVLSWMGVDYLSCTHFWPCDKSMLVMTGYLGSNYIPCAAFFWAWSFPWWFVSLALFWVFLFFASWQHRQYFWWMVWKSFDHRHLALHFSFQLSCGPLAKENTCHLDQVISLLSPCLDCHMPLLWALHSLAWLNLCCEFLNNIARAECARCARVLRTA